MSILTDENTKACADELAEILGCNAIRDHDVADEIKRSREDTAIWRYWLNHGTLTFSQEKSYKKGFDIRYRAEGCVGSLAQGQLLIVYDGEAIYLDISSPKVKTFFSLSSFNQQLHCFPQPQTKELLIKFVFDNVPATE